MDFFASESTIALADVLLRMAVAALFGIAIGLTYHRTFRGLTYSTSFRNTNVLITIIICAIILSIGSNVALSLGLVGSLSVIRFRAVVKDTMDMVYLFWSIGTGIASGAGQFQIAGVLFGLVLLVILAITFNPLREVVKSRFMIKVVYGADADVAGVEALLRERFRDLALRASFSNARNGTTEATYLVKLSDHEASSSQAVFAAAQPGVVSTQLVKFDGVQAL
jgi:uncharacterized membrane protein YhiD involved in acid resistance